MKNNFWFYSIITGLSLTVLLSSGKFAKERIVSTNGTVTEILAALGLEGSIVGTDITSNFPESIQKIPKVGHNRSISAEGVLSLNPTTLVGYSTDLTPQTKDQLKSIRQQLYNQEYSIEGTKKLIRSVALDFSKKEKGEEVIKQLEADLLKVKKPVVKKRILFIYARGAGTMMVSGAGTSVASMISLAGFENAATGFTDFKPLTTEALVSANPDVILMFDSGLKSMGGISGVMEVQGVNLTNAGKNKKIISMDGQLLSGFGPRLGIALQELINKVN
jgi:iron complex transport system substrate-binding protein